MRLTLAVLLAAIATGAAGAAGQGSVRPGRNVIVFVADGLRHDAVNATDTPALWAVRTNGVHFADSYSHFPTFTTANAASIATGHLFGDHGDFSNTVWAGHALYDTGNFGNAIGTPVPFLENDQVLGDLDGHRDGNYLGETSLLAAARANGYNTAAIGKLGPAAVQDATLLSPVNGRFPDPVSILVDDATGTPAGLALPERLRAEMERAGVALEAPTRSNGYAPTSRYNNGYSGDRLVPGTQMPNLVQQQWFIDVITRALLPLFERERKPFAMLFWSRDPDGTQHFHGDSLGQLSPGINGETVRQALRNADRALQAILDWLDRHPAIRKNTDLFVTSDHGFATISKSQIDRSGAMTASEAARHEYVDPEGRVDTAQGMLPFGFLAIDLARDLGLNLFDPDRRTAAGSALPFVQMRRGPDVWDHPILGNGLIGDAVRRSDGSDAAAIVAANGGSDLIYVPSAAADIVRTLVGRLVTYDYVGSLFVDDAYGDIPGALPFSAIGLVGSSRMPRPAIVVGFKYFYRDPNDLLTAVQITDAVLRQGQGMHGGFGRDSTYNNMAAIGPDFRRRFVSRTPVSNADIVPTLAKVMGITWAGRAGEAGGTGRLMGRAVNEALVGARSAPSATGGHLLSQAVNGRRTLLRYREFDGRRYPIESCFVGTEPPVPSSCR